ncbi:MAG: proline--tRNA ligase [Patescibacteria group bacterium]
MSRRNTKEKDLSAWYLEVVQAAQLADYAPVKGCMVIRPNGYAIWENIVRLFDLKIKAMNTRNAYFPLFIPMSFLHREKEHVEGFSPELAVVTIGGGQKLEEPLVVRPTSETIMYSMFSKWVHSWRDLPLKVNQWCNVIRWEKRTFPFLRTLEFLWQEGHTAHATLEEADKQTMDALKAYTDFIQNTLAIPVITGKKTDSQKFAGALYTTSCEAMMPDGKALQAATSHNLGQNFSKAEAFNISFQNKDKSIDYAWQTSWGLSTRIIGALIMVHGDEAGLILPPKIAPIQVVIVPIYKTNEEKESVLKACNNLFLNLKDQFSVTVDDRDDVTPGFKFHDWEMQGIPVRLEIGPAEIRDDQVKIVRRDNGQKEVIANKQLPAQLRILMEQIQKSLFARASQYLHDRTFEVKTYDEFKEVIEVKKGFAIASWCGQTACEDSIKEATKATARVVPFNQPKIQKKCVVCGKSGQSTAVWARAY